VHYLSAAPRSNMHKHLSCQNLVNFVHDYKASPYFPNDN